MGVFAALKSLDFVTLATIVPIPFFGLVMLLSLAPSLFYTQLINILVGVIVFFIVYQLDKDVLESAAIPAYILAVLMIVAVYVFGDATRGSYRWIEFGFVRIQSSEFVKPLLVVFFAWFFSTRDMQSLKNAGLAIALFAIPFILVLREPDLGSSLVLAAMFIAMLFVSGMKLKYFLILAIAALAALPFAWNFLHDYQKDRVLAFLNPDFDPLGKSYNITQSIITIGSGQIFGRGLGHGTQTQLKFLPEHTTDFIFASIGEELGLLGCAALVALYLLFFWRVLHISEEAENRFIQLLVFGIGVIIITQAFIHIGGNLGLMPLTGITLPFISYGGSSVVASSILLALLFRAIKQRRLRE